MIANDQSDKPKEGDVSLGASQDNESLAATDIESLRQEVSGLGAMVYPVGAESLTGLHDSPIYAIRADNQYIQAFRQGDEVFLLGSPSVNMVNVPYWCSTTSIASPAADTQYVQFETGYLRINNVQQTITLGTGMGGSGNLAWDTAQAITKAARFYMELDYGNATWTFKVIEAGGGTPETLPTMPAGSATVKVWPIADINWDDTNKVIPANGIERRWSFEINWSG